MVATKSEVRALIRASRAERSIAERNQAREALTGFLAQLCSHIGARSIAAFLPRDTEPPIDGFLTKAVAQGLTVLVPISHNDGSLSWIPFSGDTAIAQSELGVPEPVVVDPTSVVGPGALTTVDVVLLPAAAVDSGGMRLGWGKGYYDRALAGLPASDSSARPQTFAVVFDDEVVDAVPHESHDEPVDGVVTPSGIHRF